MLLPVLKAIACIVVFFVSFNSFYPVCERSASVSSGSVRGASTTTEASTTESSPSQSTEQSPQTSFSIFYNIFIDKSNPQLAIEIVQEQLQQIESSYAANVDHAPVSLYYTTIGGDGKSMLAIKQALNTTCSASTNSLTCQHSMHYPSGGEELTLQQLYSHCQETDDQENTRVVYLHNKGSFRANQKQNKFRRHLTMAATSQECLEPSEDTCNLCGLKFWPLWSNIMPGNMWTAQCSYVAQLVPPNEFEAALAEVKDEALALTEQGEFTMNLFDVKNREDVLGMGRYASEHWVGSHPSVTPCDLAPQSIGSLRKREVSLSDMKLELAPRQPIRSLSWGFSQKHHADILNDEEKRSKEYFLLPGFLFKWSKLYNGQLPADDSWVWSWFPDGEHHNETAAHFANLQ